MSTDVVSNEPLQTLPVELCPVVDHLVTEDDVPVDNVFSEKQQRLLTEPLHSSWTAPGQSRPFVAMANVGLFSDVHRPPLVPDALLSLDVELPADVHPKRHRSYFVWEYGKAPDVVVEVVSNREGGEDTAKLAAYARVGVRYYAIYDPEQWLGAEVLRVYRLERFDFTKWMSRSGFPTSDWACAYGTAVMRTSTTHGFAGWMRKACRSPRDKSAPTPSSNARKVPSNARRAPSNARKAPSNARIWNDSVPTSLPNNYGGLASSGSRARRRRRTLRPVGP